MESMERMESTPAGNGERISLGQEADSPAIRDPTRIPQGVLPSSGVCPVPHPFRGMLRD